MKWLKNIMAQLDVHLPQGVKFPGCNSSQHVYELWPYAGFSIEGSTRRLMAAYFGIYSRLLCV